jgi:hypothetical protein
MKCVRFFGAVASVCSALILGGCASAPSDTKRMAPRCANAAPILLMATDPAQVVIKKGDIGSFPYRTSDQELTMYRWLWLTFDRQTEACLTSPLDYIAAASKTQMDIGTVSAFGRTAAATASSVDHLGFDQQKREAILAAAASAGAKFVVVGTWVGGKSERYRLLQATGAQGSWGYSHSTVEATVDGALAQVEVQVFDAPAGALVYRKLYSGFEETQLGGGTKPSANIHAAAVRQAIASGVIEDLTRYMLTAGQSEPTEKRQAGLGMPASLPIVLKLGAKAGIGKLGVTLEEIQRSERYTRFDLRFHNLDSAHGAQVALSRNSLGLMSMAKSTSGQVYRSDDKPARRTERLMLRSGEAGTLSVVLRNDLGAMHDVALYVDVEVRLGQASGVRRATFPSIQSP